MFPYDLFMLFFFTLKQEESAHIITAVRLASFSALIFCAEEIQYVLLLDY